MAVPGRILESKIPYAKRTKRRATVLFVEKDNSASQYVHAVGNYEKREAAYRAAHISVI